MSHGSEKSDSALRVKTLTNKAGQSDAEWVEQRAETETAITAGTCSKTHWPATACSAR